MLSRVQPAGTGTVQRLSVLVVVSDRPDQLERAVLDLLAARPDLRLGVCLLPGSSTTSRLGHFERLYAAVDRRLFSRKRDSRSPTPAAHFEVHQGSVDDAAKAHDAIAVFDLTGRLEVAGATSRSVVSVLFEGRPLADLRAAVRSRVGTDAGTLEARVRVASRGSIDDVFIGHCYLEHRSTLRSVELIVHKVPTLLLAGLKRRHGDATVSGAAQTGASALTPWQLLVAVGASLVERFAWREQWKVVLYRNWSPGNAGAHWLTLFPGSSAFWADPFVVSHERGLTVYFEELPFATGKGRISALEIDKDGGIGAPHVVLDEPWHLSYPFIFEWQDRRFMIPESSAEAAVNLYECTAYPFEWKRVGRMIDNIRLADATLIEWRTAWWMFAAHSDKGASNYDELVIYSAPNPLGPWTPHPMNPVQIDAGLSRPAGSMWVSNGRLFRPVQDCRSGYGQSVVLREVVELSQTTFQERTIAELRPGDLPDKAKCHTLNRTDDLAVVDVAAKISRFSWLAAALGSKRA